MRNVLCLIGRHRWVRQHNPEVEGVKGDYLTCRRCGTDKKEYDAPPKNLYRGVWG